MLKITNLSKVYAEKNQKVTALDDLNLAITEGDFVALIGPSGCGKSTLLLTLGGMLTPTEGEVWIEHQSLYTLSSQSRAALRRTTIGFIFQTFNLVPYLTALQNVQLPLLINGLGKKEQIAQATQLLTQMGLEDRLQHKPCELSVGQQQRVALARAIITKPKLILADEPTGNLDPKTSQQVIDFLQTLNQQGTTILMVTHDHTLAAQANQILHLNAGRLSSLT